MVKSSNFTKNLKWIICLLIIVVAESVSAQNYPSRQRSSASRRNSYSSVNSRHAYRSYSNVNTDRIKESDEKKGQKVSGNKNAKDDVELVVTGDGLTKEQATMSALRSALEQTFGTFVSANTTILNDDLVKDEIVSVSAGNVKEYKYLAENEVGGKYYVTIKAIISVGKLVKYVQAKGGETELAGAAFAMDVKLKRLYQQNEEQTLQNLLTQLQELIPIMFDFSIEVESPRANSTTNLRSNVSTYYCPATVTIIGNQNYTNVWNLIWETLGALCLKSREEVEDYRAKGIEFHLFQFSNDTYNFKPTYNLPVTYINHNNMTRGDVYFRSNKFFYQVGNLINKALKFSIDDGTGNIKEGTNFRSEHEVIGTFGGGTVFPVAREAKIQMKGRIAYSEEELEKVKTIKVIPASQMNTTIHP